MGKTIFLLALVALFGTPGYTKEEIVWNNLRDFMANGWYDIDNSYAGVALNKPSDLNPSLQPLDEGVTGGGVWTGKYFYVGDYFDFEFDSDLLDPRMIEANITLKYYSSSNNRLYFSPCNDNPGTWYECVTDYGSDKLEWVTHTFPVNVTKAVGARSYGGGGGFPFPYLNIYPGKLETYVLLDEIKLTYLIE